MSVGELMKQRPSDRKYTGGAVPREMLKQCSTSAGLSPSACNDQPLRFVAVGVAELKSRVANK